MIDFLCIGAQKAATTWLYHQLKHHPSVRFPPESAGPYAPKELHFWNYYVLNGTDWWLSFFPDRTDGIIQGECTPNYCALPEYRIRSIASLCPHIRLISILRNPIERSWSAVRMFVEPSNPQLAPDLRDYFSFIDGSDCKAISDYESWIKNWRASFQDDQLYIGYYDTIEQNPRSVLFEVANHLGIPVDHFAQMPDVLLNSKHFVGPKTPMPNSIRRFLVEYYTPKIHSLSQYLNRDLSQWIEKYAF